VHQEVTISLLHECRTLTSYNNPPPTLRKYQLVADLMAMHNTFCPAIINGIKVFNLEGATKLILRNMLATKESPEKGNWNHWSQRAQRKKISSNT